MDMKRGLLAVAFFLLGAGVAQAQGAQNRPLILKCSDAVVVAKLKKATPQGVLYSLPPRYTTLLELAIEDVVWGPFHAGFTVKVYHSVSQNNEPEYSLGTKCLIALEHGWEHDVWNVLLLEGSNKENAKDAQDARADRLLNQRPSYTQTFAVENSTKTDLGAVKLYASLKRNPGPKDFEVFDVGDVRSLGRTLKKVSAARCRFVYVELRIGDKLKSPPVVAPEDQFLEAVTFDVLDFVANKKLKARAVRSEAPVP
jgi:hypothetical protein